MSTARQGNKNWLGKTHSDETKGKISAAILGKIRTEETRAKMAAAKKGNLNAMFGKTKPEGSGKPTQRISVLDVVNNNTFEYDSMSAAARALDIKQSRISKYFARNQLQPYKGRYIFSKILD
jgi:group I intron endonuclease